MLARCSQDSFLLGGEKQCGSEHLNPMQRLFLADDGLLRAGLGPVFVSYLSRGRKQASLRAV
jgi:hypothetical protein